MLLRLGRPRVNYKNHVNICSTVRIRYNGADMEFAPWPISKDEISAAFGITSGFFLRVLSPISDLWVPCRVDTNGSFRGDGTKAQVVPEIEMADSAGRQSTMLAPANNNASSSAWSWRKPAPLLGRDRTASAEPAGLQLGDSMLRSPAASLPGGAFAMVPGGMGVDMFRPTIRTGARAVPGSSGAGINRKAPPPPPKRMRLIRLILFNNGRLYISTTLPINLIAVEIVHPVMSVADISRTVTEEFGGGPYILTQGKQGGPIIDCSAQRGLE